MPDTSFAAFLQAAIGGSLDNVGSSYTVRSFGAHISGSTANEHFPSDGVACLVIFAQCCACQLQAVIRLLLKLCKF